MSLYNELMRMVITESSIEEYKNRVLREGKIKDYLNNKLYNYTIYSLDEYPIEHLKDLERELKNQKDACIKAYGEEKYKELYKAVEKTILNKDKLYKNEIEKKKKKEELERLKKEYENRKLNYFKKNPKLNDKNSKEYEEYCKKSWPIIERVISNYLNKYNNDEKIKNKYKDLLKTFYSDEPNMIKNPKFKLKLEEDYNKERVYQLIDGDQEECMACISSIPLDKDLYKDPILKSNNIYFDFEFGDGDEGCIYINF